MYKIIGGDQKEYGPVSMELVAQWVRDNRANAQTLVQKEGGPWVPLGSLPEFASILGEQSSAAFAPTSPPAPTPAPSASIGAGPGPAPIYSGPGMNYGAVGGFDDNGRERARQAVAGPGMALLVTGILAAVGTVLNLVLSLSGAAFKPPAGEIPPEMQQLFDTLTQVQGPIAIVSAVVGMVISGLIILGAQKLRNLESYAFVIVACILAIQPCFTFPCCCIGLPVGIWALVVSSRKEVKPFFR
jgi:type IV secretory pathway VirB2 component (pilin)